jgi:hypothetical protein
MCTTNYQSHTVQTFVRYAGTHRYDTTTVLLYGRDRVSHSIEVTLHHLAVFGPAASHEFFLIASTPQSVGIYQDILGIRVPSRCKLSHAAEDIHHQYDTVEVPVMLLLRRWRRTRSSAPPDAVALSRWESQRLRRLAPVSTGRWKLGGRSSESGVGCA